MRIDFRKYLDNRDKDDFQVQTNPRKGKSGLNFGRRISLGNLITSKEDKDDEFKQI